MRDQSNTWINQYPRGTNSAPLSFRPRRGGVRRLFFVTILLALLAATTALAAEKRFDIPLEDSPRIGPDNAPVTIVEFLDFQ